MVTGSLSDDLVRRLRWHAGLEEGPNASAISVSECLDWRGDLVGDLAPALADLVDSLAWLNRELNGDKPSEGQGAASVPRDVAYALSEIVRLLRTAADKGGADAGSIATAAKKIEAAWGAVLAGDIDDIPEHLAQEFGADRG